MAAVEEASSRGWSITLGREELGLGWIRVRVGGSGFGFGLRLGLGLGLGTASPYQPSLPRVQNFTCPTRYSLHYSPDGVREWQAKASLLP